MTQKQNKETAPGGKRSLPFHRGIQKIRRAKTVAEIAREIESELLGRPAADPVKRTEPAEPDVPKRRNSPGSSALPDAPGSRGKKKPDSPGTGKKTRARAVPAARKTAPADPPADGPKPRGAAVKKTAVPKKKTAAAAAGKTAGATKPKLRIISLGGLGEIGKNITVFETDSDIIVADCGAAFPDDELPGVDLVIPDFSYLVKNQKKIRGIFVTHGHEDHIGGLPFLLKEIRTPVYGTPLTVGLIAGKLEEHDLLKKSELNVVHPGDTVRAGTSFRVEFIRVNHSIPDSCALAIHSPAGVIVLTGDFKVDFTPISGETIDLNRFAELGSEGVLALLGDSTNAEKPGFTPSERIVSDSFNKFFTRADRKRIIVATFSSNVNRVQQVVDTAVRFGRKVAVFGRSMTNVVSVARELGYLTIPKGVLVDVNTLGNYTDDQIVLITTGSQGEPMSALTRMATGSHRNVRIGPNDCIIISATPIPGNEKTVGNVVNELMRLGADVIYERMYDVHVSGHACQDETRLLLSLTKPKFFVPMHGEYKHLAKNAQVGASMGLDPEHIILSDIGKIIETDGRTMKLAGVVPSGRVLVDGLGIGDVGSIVLRDRKLLADEGLIAVVTAVDRATQQILAGPTLVSRGFIYVRENEDLMAEATEVVRKSLEKLGRSGFTDWNAVKGRVRDDLGTFIFTRTKRRPLVIPVLQEV